MLTKAELAKYEDRNQVAAALRKGVISEKDLIGAYRRLRQDVMSNIRRIQKSDIPFLPGKIPAPPTIKDLTGALGVNQRALLYETGQMLKFLHSKSYTREQRKAQRKFAIESLAKHGIHIKESEWGLWREFMELFKHTEYAALFDSDEQVVQDIFAEGSRAEEWDRLFKEWVSEHGTH